MKVYVLQETWPDFIETSVYQKREDAISALNKLVEEEGSGNTAVDGGINPSSVSSSGYSYKAFDRNGIPMKKNKKDNNKKSNIKMSNDNTLLKKRKNNDDNDDFFSDL